MYCWPVDVSMRLQTLSKGGSRGDTAYLGTTSGVLRGSARNELCIVILDQVFVEAHVLVFGEDGVVGLKAILAQHSIISAA